MVQINGSAVTLATPGRVASAASVAALAGRSVDQSGAGAGAALPAGSASTDDADDSAGGAQPTPGLVVLGRDEMGRSHASWFDEGEIIMARKAAALMNMAALPITSAAISDLAARLPQGRLFASGKAFVPFVKGELYAQLVTHLSEAEQMRLATAGEGGAASSAGSGSTSSLGGGAGGSGQGAGGPDAGWHALTVGSVVIALDTPDDGWWPAVVVKVSSDNLFTLRWRDYDDLPTFMRPRRQIALAHPDMVAGKGA
ncbi:tudor domain-containing protein [Aureimonas jatrophae]|uniref:Uncharacterized protein n=1 Tax=Aureimonas jatrophae TaxID=1166073 RepID=A0A1H0NJB1_9HYPH|nr:tudor domain-containing protein [Aureimonas jatrophae]MBB3953067.1 hypothetical protein [Aureimonas jatrophae]SDO92440.1 hypothetical protein SAMN05192530_12214 [Aureimonas jatrophae]